MVKDLKKNLLSLLNKTSDGLTEIKLKRIRKKVSALTRQAEKIQEEIFLNDSVLSYHHLKKVGFTDKQIQAFAKEDAELCQEAKNFLQNNADLVETFYGYHLNLMPDSPAVRYLRYLETKIRTIDNCGDDYEEGFFHLNCKKEEREILDILYDHFGTSQKEGAWGYLASGGSESNRWGIENGIQTLGGGRAYFSAAAHYSVPKAVQLGPTVGKKMLPTIAHTVIPTEKNSERIDVDALISEVTKNWKENKEPAVILLTWGTTKTGATDDVAEITKRLNALKIPHYIHLDAALYGGMATNQIKSPTVPTFKRFDVDSISVSLHKYFGHHEIKSALIARQKPLANMVDYIGLKDSTTAGSRGLNPFSARQRIKEMLFRKDEKDYTRNIDFFENMLKENKIFYTRDGYSNLFIIKRPSEKICHRFQLSTFNVNGQNMAHIMIFPFHSKKLMKEIIRCLKAEQ